MSNRTPPSGPVSRIFYEFEQQLRAANRHLAAEGHQVSGGELLDSYDRALHPWMHGRRFPDLVERATGWLP